MSPGCFPAILAQGHTDDGDIYIQVVSIIMQRLLYAFLLPISQGLVSIGSGVSAWEVKNDKAYGWTGSAAIIYR